MEKFKKVAFSFMMFALMFIGAGVVEAKSYTAYTTGDEITVKLNDTKTEKFYIINDSDSSKETVTAIYKGTLNSEADGFGKVTYAEAETKISELNNEWSNVATIMLPTMQQIFGEDVVLTESFNFTEPSYALTNIGYWTSTIGQLDDVSGYWNVVILLDNGSAGVDDVNSHSAVRPVITVYKDYVVGGVTETEEDTLWEGFIEKFKDSSNPVFGTYDSSKIVINHTNDSLTVTTDVEGVSYTTQFTYANGILTYVPTTDPSNAFIDTMWVGNAIISLVKFKNYNGDRVSAWMLKNTNPTLAKDGISYTEYENVITGSAPGVDASLTSTAFSSFEMDLVNGIKTLNDVVEDDNNTTEEPKEDVTENPDTGLFEQYGLVIAVILGVGVLGYISTRKHSRFPQA